MLTNLGRVHAAIALATLWATAYAADSIGDYGLPAKTAFPADMPRYPNAWFYIDASLAPSFEAAVKLVTAGLRQAMHLPEYYPPFDNPEGCDFEVRVEHLQPGSIPCTAVSSVFTRSTCATTISRSSQQGWRK